ncbi:50S ribosomal protein L13 [Candidatus Woesearchaeota archaeon]|nr:50S ribosomal protein L13 [Candidatus Woesearchaeota archaeon]
MIIDVTNLILGRMATFVAKQALLGEEIKIVNCEKAVMTGNKKTILAKYKEKIKMGKPQKGPFIPRRADMFVKRSIRGMLPYKQEKGLKAFKRVSCYVDVPEEFKGKKLETIDKANVSKIPNLKYITISEVCKSIGGKW